MPRAKELPSEVGMTFRTVKDLYKLDPGLADELEDANRLAILPHVFAVRDRSDEGDEKPVKIVARALPTSEFYRIPVKPGMDPRDHLMNFRKRPAKVEHMNFTAGTVDRVFFSQENMWVLINLFPPSSHDDPFKALVVRDALMDNRLKQLSISFHIETGWPKEISLCMEGKMDVQNFQLVMFSKDQQSTPSLLFPLSFFSP